LEDVDDADVGYSLAVKYLRKLIIFTVVFP